MFHIHLSGTRFIWFVLLSLLYPIYSRLTLVVVFFVACLISFNLRRNNFWRMVVKWLSVLMP